MIELHNTVASNLRPIGTFLEIPIGELNTIAERERGDPQRCLMEMLGVWLHRTNPPASWPDIADAVEFTGRPDIAKQISQKYYKLVATLAASVACNMLAFSVQKPDINYSHFRMHIAVE